MRGIFVTATGTGVGKTVIAAGILRLLRSRGIGAAPMKPIQTGCVPGMSAESGSEEGLRIPDLEFALSAAGIVPNIAELELMAPFRYEFAASPHLAARMEGPVPSLAAIVDSAERLAAAHEAIVVEGIGGILVPINETDTVLDMIARLDLPVVVVAPAGLGAINHTLLTLRALREAGARVLGVIYNNLEHFDEDAEEADIIRKDNPIAVEHFSGIQSLGSIPFMDGIGGDSSLLPVWEEFENAMTGFEIILNAVRGTED